jgi:hypothetical protein
MGALPTTLMAPMPAPTPTFSRIPLRIPLISPLRRIQLRRAPTTRRTSIPLAVPLALKSTITTRIGTVAPMALPGGIPQIGLEQKEGLWVVSDAAQPVAKAVLSSMTYKGGPMTAEEGSGQASFVIGSLPTISAWQTIQDMIAAGYAALVEKASITTGTLNLLFTKSSSTVAAKAGGEAASHALLSMDEPQNVLQGALAQLHGGTVPASVVEGEKPAVERPAWLVPVLVGAGALLIGYFIFGGRKATANQRRSRYRRNAKPNAVVRPPMVIVPRDKERAARILGKSYAWADPGIGATFLYRTKREAMRAVHELSAHGIKARYKK